MAYAPEQDQNQQQGQNPLAQPPTTSSAPGAGPGAVKGSTAPQATPTQPFQNLQAYLTANAPQISQQAGQISGNLANQYGQVQSDINQGKESFNQQIQSGYTAPNQDIINQAVSNPAQFAQNPENVKAFQSLYNDQYTGPANYETSSPYGALNAEVQNAVSQANAFKTPAGAQTYFQNQNPNATKGGNILDTVLLQGNPEAYQQILSAAKPFENLPGYLNQSVTDVNQNIQNAQNTAQQTAQGLQNQFVGQGGIIPTFQNELQNRVNQNEANREALNQEYQIRQQIQSELNPVLGNMPNSLTDYLSKNYFNLQPNQTPATLQNVSTPEDYQRAQALASLTGQPGILPTDASQAGTFNIPQFEQTGNKGQQESQIVKNYLNAFTTPGGQPITQQARNEPPNSQANQQLAKLNEMFPDTVQKSLGYYLNGQPVYFYDIR